MASSNTGVVALISGRGSNLQAIIDQARSGALDIQLRAVISNRPDAAGIARAGKLGIPTAVVDHRDYSDREQYDQQLMQVIDSYGADLVVLAGFMRILTPGFVAHYAGRMLNIHPSLLPKYRGLHTHQRALEAGDQEHGATVHFVTPELDGGPAIIQAKVPVLGDDTEESLASRVLAEEHKIYPQAVQWFSEGRIRLENGEILLDEAPLSGPVIYSDQ